MTSPASAVLVHPLDLTRPSSIHTPEHTRAKMLGGKGANLVRLKRAGFAVPNGFVVTTAAYRAAVRRNLKGATDLETIRTILQTAPLPSDLLQALRHHFEHLTGDRPQRPLAVRSSAAAEDGVHHSFAGQQASFLGVSGFDALCDHIRQVWASLFDHSAAIYRSQTSLEALPPQMAVVVQEMVKARSAGVCFTANPVSGAVGDAVVSATRGLGTTVVDGNPCDTFYVRRRDGRIIDRELNPQAEILELDDNAQLVRRPLTEERTAHPSLSDADLSRVVRLALQIEERLGGTPQDVEWAFDEGGGLWALQTRPITAAGGADIGDTRPSVWTNINVGEALPGVGTPMTWSVLRAFSRRGFETAFGALGLEVPERYALVGSFYGRVYLNLTEFASIITQIPVMRPETLLEVAGGPAIDQIRGNYDEHSSRHFLSRLPLTVPRIVLSQVSMPLIGHHWANVLRRRSDAFLREDLARLSRNALEARMASVDRWFTWTGLVMLACSSNFLSSYVVTRELLARWGGSRAATRENRLFSGLTGLRSAEPGLELLRMARHVRSQPHLEAWLRSQPPATLAKDLDAMVAFPGGFGLRQQLHHFLREYGHRAPREAELATPRWREDPTFVLEVLRTYLEAPHMPDPDQLARDREEARQETTEAIRRHFTTGLGLIFRQFLRLSQHNARLREDLRDCVVETLTMYRHLFLEVGRRLVGRGVVSTADDIFFLTQDEVREVLQGSPTDDLGVRVALRRAEYNAFQNTPDPPETFTLSRGRIHSTEPETPGPKDELHGLPGSSGRVTARARVILDPTAPDAQLHPGEILVAPLTDVGWTPLFLAASGVVMDKGGPLSHSCIVAREYGIPAVVNVKRGTALIQTGDLITLDGDRGVVYLPHRAEP